MFEVWSRLQHVPEMRVLPADQEVSAAMTWRERNHYKWWMMLLEECELHIGRHLLILGAKFLDRQFNGTKAGEYMGSTEHFSDKHCLRWRIELS